MQPVGPLTASRPGSPSGTGLPSSSRIAASYPGTARPVEPGRISSSADEMKMCSISVLPIPSMIFTPVAS